MEVCHTGGQLMMWCSYLWKVCHTGGQLITFCSYLWKVCNTGGQLMTWCDHCQLYQPARSSHCHFCDVCVRGRDHHCVWFVPPCTCQIDVNFPCKSAPPRCPLGCFSLLFHEKTSWISDTSFLGWIPLPSPSRQCKILKETDHCIS